MRPAASCAVDRSTHRSTHWGLDFRMLTAAEHPTSAALVAEWMDLGDEDTITQTFPAIFHPSSQAGRYGVFEKGLENRLVCHVATRQVTLHTAAGPRQALLIGAVATDPGHRGQGLATKLLEQIIQEARGARLDTLLLWSDLWEFYGRLGFVPAGRQFEVCLHRSRPRPRPNSIPSPSRTLSCIRPAAARDIPALLALHQKKPWRVQRSPKEMELLLSTKPMTTMVLELAGEIRAYACLGKGLDFGGWWHEMGGSDEDVARLIFGGTRSLGQDQATVLVPPYRPLLLERLGPAHRPAQAGVCALELRLNDQDEDALDGFFVDGLDSI